VSCSVAHIAPCARMKTVCKRFLPQRDYLGRYVSKSKLIKVTRMARPTARLAKLPASAKAAGGSTSRFSFLQQIELRQRQLFFYFSTTWPALCLTIPRDHIGSTANCKAMDGVEIRAGASSLRPLSGMSTTSIDHSRMAKKYRVCRV
jgi:hypothetical protein